MDVEDAFKVVGSLGRFQKCIVLSHFLLNISYGFQLVLMVIVAATPDPKIPSERNMTTIVTEWKLEDWTVDLMSSLFMAGYGVGCAIMGQVSDLYGRKKTFLSNYTIMHLSSLCCYFTHRWETFAFLRTVCGFFVGGSGHVMFALLVENIGKEHWGAAGVLSSLFFSVGVMLLSMFGYLLQDWRTLCLLGSVVPLVAVPIYAYILPESSRWLYHVGKVEEAENVLRYIASKNGASTSGISLRNNDDGSTSHGEDMKKYSIIDMFKRKKLAIYAATSFYLWFACSFVYYGLTLDAKFLSPNIFLANTLSGAIECPALMITYFTITRRSIGRKGTLVGCFLLSTVSSIGMLFATGLMSDNLSTVRMVLGLTNKLAVAGAFSLLYVYTAEVFPTQLRLVAIGGSSFFARVGAIISPFVPLLAPVRSYLPYIVYGVASICGAALNLILPETLGRPSPEMSDFQPKVGSAIEGDQLAACVPSGSYQDDEKKQGKPECKYVTLVR